MFDVKVCVVGCVLLCGSVCERVRVQWCWCYVCVGCGELCDGCAVCVPCGCLCVVL